MTHQPNTPASRTEAAPKAFDAFLCRAWGETDRTSAAMVPDWEGVRSFMVREWLGKEDEEVLLQLREDFGQHEEEHNGRGGAYAIEFEIGGVSVERVCGFASRTEQAVPSVASGVETSTAVLNDLKDWLEGLVEANFNGHVPQSVFSEANEYIERIEAFAAPSAAIAAREQEAAQSFRVVATVLPSVVRSADSHWCREALLYSPASPHDYAEKRIDLYALASRQEAPVASGEPPAVDAGEKEAKIAPVPYDKHEAEILAVIDERDRYHDMADQLADQIAAITGEEIGEHSSDNDPWHNAMLSADEWIARDLRAMFSGEAEPHLKALRAKIASRPEAPPASASPATVAQPVDMVLHCPKCGLQHVDNREHGHGPYGRTVEWDNPPHRSHLCHGCGHIWRPADVPTNGVQAVKTTGKNDSPIAQPCASQGCGGDGNEAKQALIDWVASRWHAEVANRPLVNVHRRSLDDTWRQILRRLGVDDRSRLGPTHDELAALSGLEHVGKESANASD